MNTVVFEGIDGSGKSTIFNIISKDETYKNISFKDRDRKICDLTLRIDNDIGFIPEKNTKYIIFDIDPYIAFERISHREKLEPYEYPRYLFYFRNVYRMLAVKYGFYLIDANKTIEEVLKQVKDVIDDKIRPIINIDNIDVEKLPIVIQGCSKIVRSIPEDERFHLIEYKPTVYSHTNQSSGIVEGTDIERLSMTRLSLYIFWMNEIDHAYLYVGNKYILTRKIEQRDIPDIECIYKRMYIGSDKHRYYNLQERKTRKPIIKELKFDNTVFYEYTEPYFRCDLRNPNHITKKISNYDSVTNMTTLKEITVPLGDYNLSPDLADYFIDYENAKSLTLKVGKIMTELFEPEGLIWIDFCIMLTSDGKTVYGEFSQDCTRVSKIDATPLTKDIWRAGGSNPDKSLVLERYKLMSSICYDIVKKYISKIMSELF